MRFAIVGAGAIGCLFGVKLSLDGNDVTLVHHDGSIVREILRRGISLEETNGKTRVVHVPIRKGPLRLRNVEVLIVAVKAYDTRKVASEYRRKVDNDTTILSLQNGLGNVETLQSHLKNPLLAGSTSEGSLSLGPGRILHTGAGSTIIGNANDVRPEIARRVKKAFERSGFRTRIDSNIRGVLWTKAIVNAAINPLSALARMSNGGLARNHSLAELGSEVMKEGVAVSREEHVKLAGNPLTLWHRILVSTGPNKSSMLQDVEKGRMTEIRELNGSIVSRARKAGVKVPINEVLTKLIIGLESNAINPRPTR